MTGGAFAGWAINAMLASALLMAVVLLVRGPVRRMFGPQIAYLLWALPLLRLVLPPLPTIWHAAATTPIGRAGETLVLIVRPAAEPAAPTIMPTLIALLVAAWGVGIVAFLLFHAVGHWRFCRRVLADARLIDRLDGVRVVASPAAAGPLAFGIWRRCVAFPVDMAERYDADERALALAHELNHHRRGDLLANWAALGVLALHWFNPLCWHAFRAFRTDQELANDAAVLAGRSAHDRHVYARALVKAAHGGAVSAACHLHTITDLKGRLKMLAISPTSRRRLASGAATVGALLVAGLGLTASGSSAAAISAEVQRAVEMPATPELPQKPEPPILPSASTAASVPASATVDHRISRVVVTKDGRSVAHNDYTSADIDAGLAAGDHVAIQPLDPDSSRMIVKADSDPDLTIEVQDIPAMKSATCGIGSGKPAAIMTQHGKGDRRLIVVCTDRIRKVTADAMVTVGNTRNVERNAYAQALSGLMEARTKVVADNGMTAPGRTEALTAIDQSIAEMKAQLARYN